MFKFVRSLDGSYLQPRTVKAVAGTYKTGMALKIGNGVAAAASGNVKVTLIALENKTLDSEGELIVADVTHGMIFEAPISAFSASTQKVGASVTIHTDSLGVTATAAATLYASTASGSYSSGSEIGAFSGACIYDMGGAAAAGDVIHIRFN